MPTWLRILPAREPVLRGPGRFSGVNPMDYRLYPVSFRPK
jgi:hypothetical protein